uniref:Uncharacterized protein n=1 Tax=Neolamprologus brichardi TaxID=32507 RepID=A0A3Q4HR55_NEOBR
MVRMDSGHNGQSMLKIKLPGRRKKRMIAEEVYGCNESSRRNPPFPSVVRSVQEPSIITDGRLTRHHGLFNHEVKSIDFERLLSEQPKLEEQRKEKNTVISHSSSASHNSASLSTDALLGADTDVGSCVPFRKNTDPASKPSFPYQSQLPNTYAGEPMHIAQQEDPFGTDMYSCVPSFAAPVHHQSSHFQPSNQFSHASACSLKSQHTDIMHYPPSFILERDPAPSLSAFLSPEQWSFPPMRLY